MAAGAKTNHGQLGDGNTHRKRRARRRQKAHRRKGDLGRGRPRLALLANGTVMAWGDNEDGSARHGQHQSSDVPVAVKGLSGVSADRRGRQFSLALLSNGTVKAWGSDEYGQLGAPSQGKKKNGQRRAGLGRRAQRRHVGRGGGQPRARAARQRHRDGVGRRQLRRARQRQRSARSRKRPVAVSGLSGVQAISAGGQDSAALLATGPAVTWGINKCGTLGDGTSGEPERRAGERERHGQGGERRRPADRTMLAYGEPIPHGHGRRARLGRARPEAPA